MKRKEKRRGGGRNPTLPSPSIHPSRCPPVPSRPPIRLLHHVACPSIHPSGYPMDHLFDPLVVSSSNPLCHARGVRSAWARRHLVAGRFGVVGGDSIVTGAIKPLRCLPTAGPVRLLPVSFSWVGAFPRRVVVLGVRIGRGK